MRHYCNRKPPKADDRYTEGGTYGIAEKQPADSIPEDKVVTGSISSADEDEIILPPASTYGLYENDFAVGGAISQSGGYNKQRAEDEGSEYTNTQTNENAVCGSLQCYTKYMNDLSGRMNVVSIPQSKGGRISMASYLSRYRGKYICMDLWTPDGTRMERCGLLSEIGEDFLVITKTCTGEVLMVDLKTIRYISIYCR